MRMVAMDNAGPDKYDSVLSTQYCIITNLEFHPNHRSEDQGTMEPTPQRRAELREFARPSREFGQKAQDRCTG